MKTMRTPPDPAGCQCGCTVSLAEMGLDPAALPAQAAAAGVTYELVYDWANRPALSPADARRVHQAIRAHQEAHSTRWRAYQAYVEDEKRKAREAAQEAARKAREEWKERAVRLGEAQRRAAEEQVAREAAMKAEAEAARKGRPVPFEKFSQKFKEPVT